MARDRRTYQFVQEARYRRRTIHETTNAEDMAKRITDYVASRMLERERALVSEEQAIIERRARERGAAEQGSAAALAPKGAAAAIAGDAAGTGKEKAAEAGEKPAAASPDDGNSVGLRLFVAFVLGVLTGAVGLFLVGANYMQG